MNNRNKSSRWQRCWCRLVVAVAAAAVLPVVGGLGALAGRSLTADSSTAGASAPPTSTADSSLGVMEFASPLPPTAQLVFQSGGIMVSDIGGGSSIEPLVPEVPGGQEHPDWSPDGRFVVFDTDFAQLWVAPMSGAASKVLFECVAPCAAAYNGAWSPNGEEIAFAVAETEDGNHTSRAVIMIANVATGEIREVYSDRSGVVWIFQPRWSPDASQLVFEAATFASNRLDEDVVMSAQIAVASVAGAETVRYLSAPDDGATTADWSPIGDLIVFARQGNLVTVTPDGRAEHQITEFDGVSEHAIQPTFLPDGDGIVFTHVTGEFGVDDQPVAAVIGLDGSGLADLPLGPATHVRVNPVSM